MRVLTWNLFHGRSVPDTPRSLLPEFAAALAGWDWDVALLQEVPPWWPPALARASGAPWARTALTSRNQLLAVRRAVANRRPDLARSSGGGANAILVRATAGTVVEHRRHTLTWLPERRVAHAVALAGGRAAELTGDAARLLWVGNLHASQARPVARAIRDGAAAIAWLTSLAPGAAQILGGDFNDRVPQHRAWLSVASRSVDHVLVRGPLRASETVAPHRAREVDGSSRRLSDHPPLAVTVCQDGEPGTRGGA